MLNKYIIIFILLNCYLYSQSPVKEYLLDINRLKIPISNNGIIANLDTLLIENVKTSGAVYDNNIILWSGGFFLSGKNGSEFWSSSIIPNQRILDYNAGTVGSNPSNPENGIYVIENKYSDFNSQWNTWAGAVNLGASFYDGDGDSIYNPVDLNGNGIWDLDEDCPGYIGDVSIWCVFNDNVPMSLRSIISSPMKIEIKQTAFAYSPESLSELEGVIFVRYKLENKSNVIFDSLYFSIYANPDIGDWKNDYVASDTLLQAVYCYDKVEDDVYVNSPSMMVVLLQGPPVYIAGETYIDNNLNGTYEADVDQALDSARQYSGLLLGKNYIYGAKNRRFTSSHNYFSASIGPFYPWSVSEIRNNQRGLSTLGELYDPCSFGEVFGENCSEVSPYFVYSGDPVNNMGWLGTFEYEQSFILNTGPFKLEPGKPKEVIAAYIAERGNTSLESVSKTKQTAQKVIAFYNSNFSSLPVSVDKTKDKKAQNFTLYQNYPNPFNPTTTIKYRTPPASSPLLKGRTEVGFVCIKIFNLLGQEVATLVNKYQSPGTYEVNWDASEYPSGVYFYTLFVNHKPFATRKLMLVK